MLVLRLYRVWILLEASTVNREGRKKKGATSVIWQLPYYVALPLASVEALPLVGWVGYCSPVIYVKRCTAIVICYQLPIICIEFKCLIEVCLV